MNGTLKKIDGSATPPNLPNQYTHAARGLLAELAAAGYPVASVNELYNGKMKYKSATPILLKWLPLVSNAGVKSEIALALSLQTGGAEVATALLDEYQRVAADNSLKWSLASAISNVADDGIFETIAALVKDQKNGKSREMLVVSLANPSAHALLLSLLDDEQLVGHAAVAVGRARLASAKPKLERLLKHPKAWVRSEARRTLHKIARVDR